MDKTARIGAIRAAAKLACKADLRRLMKTPFDRRSARIEAMSRVTATEARLETILASIAAPAGSGAAAREAEDAVDEVVLEAVRLSFSTSASLDMRAGQLEAIHKGEAERRAEIAAIDRAKAPAQAAADAVNRAGAALKALKTLASDPKRYIGLAEQFWNNQARALASTLGGDARIDGLSLAASEKVLDAMDRKLSLSANRISAASVGRVIGLAGVGLIVVSVVIRAVADEAHWAETLAKSGLSTGISLGLGFAITADAVQTIGFAASAAIAGWVAPSVTVVSSEIVTLSLAGSAVEGAAVAGAATLEAPPVAAVIVATGVVIALGLAAAALVDFLIDTIFGGPIPPSMMVSMHAPMEMSMSAQMASPMFRSMSGG